MWVEYCARKKHNHDYNILTGAQQSVIHDKAEERCIAYPIVLNSGSQHEHLGMLLPEDFAKKVNNYPKTIQKAKSILINFPRSLQQCKRGQHLLRRESRRVVEMAKTPIGS